MKHALFIIPIFMLFTGCTPVIKPFLWLTGTWEMANPDGSHRLEIWKKERRKVLTGKGLHVTGSDTLLLESIVLHQYDSDFWYVPTVPDQNKGAEIPFKLISRNDFKFIFENPDHDFPQRIVYHFKPIRWNQGYVSSPGDTLFARVESMEGKGINYLFLRK